MFDTGIPTRWHPQHCLPDNPDDVLQMDQESPSPDDPASDGPPPMAGQDLLPEVEAPSAGFILQLFVVPALIVLVVFSVWLVFSWLVHRTMMSPDKLIQGLESSGVERWQRAHELADLLRNDRHAEFRDDAAAASKIASILDREIDAAGIGGTTDDEAASLRLFLCRALGEFRVAEGLDVLVKAATTNREPSNQEVRRGAVQAIAVRAYNLSQLDPPQTLDDVEIESALRSLATDEDKLIRSETAYALGRIATPASITLLERMVHDPHPDARYNAAVALAQQGNTLAVETLAEMLDPAEMASVRQEESEAAQFYKRGLIMTCALNAVEELASRSPGADLSAVIDVLDRVVELDDEQLWQARIHTAIVKRSQRTLTLLQGLASESTSTSSE